MNNHTPPIVNRLLQTLRKEEKSFENAADAIKDSKLKNFLYLFSRDMGNMADELIMFAFADPSAATPTFPKIPHKDWSTISSPPANQDDRTILAECECEGNQAILQFREALIQPLPSEMYSTVISIASRVIKVHEEIKSLRNKLTLA